MILVHARTEGVMSIDSIRRRAGGRTGGALRAATIIALVAGCSGSPADPAEAAAVGRAAQTTNEDPCRFYTAEAMGKAFGRPMTSSRNVDVCKYQGAGSDVVVVKIGTGPEGTILRHLKSAPARGAEKVATAAGEAYFDSVIPVFVGRVGDHEVQIETTIQPTPREAMIAVGTRIMETLARK
jgi:hypothetical protein